MRPILSREIITFFARNRLVSAVVEDIAVGSGGLGFDSRAGQIRLGVASSTFLRSCVAQALSCGNEPAAHYTLRRSTASVVKI